MKKILSLLLILSCLMLSVCSLGISASAEDAYSGACGADGSSLEWAFDATTGALTVSGTGAMKDYSTEDTEQAPWYAYRNEIKSVFLPDGLTRIGSCAFRNCAELTSVTIPSSVTFIGASAFENCGKLAEVVFNDAEGWYVSESAESVVLPLYGEDLADGKIAAEYLTDTYVGYEWACVEYHDIKGVSGIGFLIPFIITAVLIILVAVWSILFIIAIIAFPFAMISNSRKRKKAEQRQRELEEERRKAITVLKCVGVAALAVGVISLFRRRK